MPSDYRKAVHPQSLARIVHEYALLSGIDADIFSAHVTRVTAATKAHENGADLHELKEWLGHSSDATMGLYIRRRYKPEKSPAFKTDF